MVNADTAGLVLSVAGAPANDAVMEPVTPELDGAVSGGELVDHHCARDIESREQVHDAITQVVIWVCRLDGARRQTRLITRFAQTPFIHKPSNRNVSHNQE